MFMKNIIWLSLCCLQSVFANANELCMNVIFQRQGWIRVVITAAEFRQLLLFFNQLRPLLQGL